MDPFDPKNATLRMTVPDSLRDEGEEERVEKRGGYLIVMAGANVGQVYSLQPEVTLIGRDDGVDVQIMDGRVSRRHASITWNAGLGHYEIRDLGSSNGTLVNGVTIDGPWQLSLGDKVQLGAQTVLRFSAGAEVETQYARRMYQAALRDGLTGVYNRRYLNERLIEEVAFAIRHETPLAIVFLDIDHFKSFNDDYDHQCGDAILRQFAQLVDRVIRAEDVLVRYGGEEFAIIGRETTEAQAAIMAERIRRTVESHPFSWEDRTLSVTVSIGVAALEGNDLVTPEALLAAADQAEIQAKERGRNLVVCYSESP